MKLKFTSFILIILSAMTGCVKNYTENDIEPKPQNGIRADTNPYYWAGNKKVVVEAQPEKSFIIFDGTDRYDIIDANKMDYSVFKTAKVTEGRMFRNGLTRAADIENAAWAIGTTRAFDMSEDKILYKSQAYKNNKGTDVFVSHLFYVKLKSAGDYAELQRMAEENNVEIIGKVGEYLDLWYKMACNAESDCDALAMSARFYESGLFQYAEPDIMFEVRSCSKQPNSYPQYQTPTRTSSDAPAPNDPLFSRQWYLHNPGGLDINYLEAKAITQGDSNITILIIDPDRIANNHPDLPTLIHDFHYPTDAADIHGTSCAGIIGAKTNNGLGIAGIAPNCKLAYCQIDAILTVDKCATVANCLMTAFNAEADVLSCSWEFYPDVYSESTTMLVEESVAHLLQGGRWHANSEGGCIIVCAAGNNRLCDDISFPACTFSEIITVGAITKNGRRHPESNYGLRLDLVAPGDSIYTTMTLDENLASSVTFPPQTYYRNNFSHTSAACPQVAAAAALILSVNPDLYYYEVEEYLLSTARKLPGYNSPEDLEIGFGLLDIGAALQAVLNDMEK